MIYSSEMNRLAYASDVATVRKLRKNCSNEKDFEKKLVDHKSSRNSIVHYWSVLHDSKTRKFTNLINVHTYVCMSLLELSDNYSDFSVKNHS